MVAVSAQHIVGHKFGRRTRYRGELTATPGAYAIPHRNGPNAEGPGFSEAFAKAGDRGRTGDLMLGKHTL